MNVHKTLAEIDNSIQAQQTLEKVNDIMFVPAIHHLLRGKKKKNAVLLKILYRCTDAGLQIRKNHRIHVDCSMIVRPE